MKYLLLLAFLTAAAWMYSCGKDEIPPEFELYVPTAFTPDGDGVNDSFMVNGANITFYHIDIYSPSNVLVYASGDIRRGWDGKYKGDPMPPDNYLWVIEYVNTRSEKHKNTGHVELVR